MAGQLDSLFKNVAKSVVKDLGTSLDTSVTYTRKASATYSVATGAVTSTDTSYSFKAPVELLFLTRKAATKRTLLVCTSRLIRLETTKPICKTRSR